MKSEAHCRSHIHKYHDKSTKLATGSQTTSPGSRYRLTCGSRQWVTLLHLAVIGSHGYQTSFTFSLVKCGEQNVKNCTDHMTLYVQQQPDCYYSVESLAQHIQQFSNDKGLLWM
jgi:hypothetical protein